MARAALAACAAFALAACGSKVTPPVGPGPEPAVIEPGPPAAPPPAPAGIELVIHADDQADAQLAAMRVALDADQAITISAQDRVLCRAQPPPRGPGVAVTATGAGAYHPPTTITVTLQRGAIAIARSPGGHVDRVGPPFAIAAIVDALPDGDLYLSADPGVGADELIAALGPLCKRFPVVHPVAPPP